MVRNVAEDEPIYIIGNRWKRNMKSYMVGAFEVGRTRTFLAANCDKYGIFHVRGHWAPHFLKLDVPRWVLETCTDVSRARYLALAEHYR